MLTHLSLFSGIGGIDLAAEWAGFKTIAFCEIDSYCQKVLKKHWPNVPIIGDIHDIKGQDFKSVDLITGGFPCQPFSTAGKRKGTEDNRYLWPEMLRVIREIKPTWVIGENVAGILSMAIEQVLFDLESADYKLQAFLIPACGVGAWHRRDRVFIVANSKCSGLLDRQIEGLTAKTRQQTFSDAGTGGTDGEVRWQAGELAAMADSPIKGLERYGESKRTWEGERPVPANAGAEVTTNTRGIESGRLSGIGWQDIPTVRNGDCRNGTNYWSTEPNVGRVAHGVPHRVDRLKCLGNAVVPQQVYPILKAIADIERSVLNDK